MASHLCVILIKIDVKLEAAFNAIDFFRNQNWIAYFWVKSHQVYIRALTNLNCHYKLVR